MSTIKSTTKPSNKQPVFLIARIGMVLAASVLAGAVQAQSAGEIRIGVPQPMTGPYAMFGDEIQAGVLTAIEVINAAGGINGKRLTTVLVDDACEPKQAIPAVNRLVNDGIKFVVGHSCSGTVIPVVNIYESEGIVAITPGATSPLVTDTAQPHYVFRTIGRDDQGGPFAANYIAQTLKPSRVAVLHDKQTYGAGLANQVQAALTAQGVNVVAYEGINAGENDYSATLTKLKSAGVDFVYFGGYYPEYGLLLRQSRELGFDAQFMAPEGAVTSDLVALAGPAIAGALAVFPADFTKMPGNEAIVAAFRAARRDPVGIHQMSAYAAVQILAASIAAVGDDPTRVADYMHTHDFDTTIGKVAYDAKGDLKNFVFVVLQFDRDGNTTQL